MNAPGDHVCPFIRLSGWWPIVWLYNTWKAAAEGKESWRERRAEKSAHAMQPSRLLLHPILALVSLHSRDPELSHQPSPSPPGAHHGDTSSLRSLCLLLYSHNTMCAGICTYQIYIIQLFTLCT